MEMGKYSSSKCINHALGIGFQLILYENKHFILEYYLSFSSTLNSNDWNGKINTSFVRLCLTNIILHIQAIQMYAQRCSD